MADQPVESQVTGEIGWRVLDPDGNVVESGPVLVMEAVSDLGQTDPEEGA